MQEDWSKLYGAFDSDYLRWEKNAKETKTFVPNSLLDARAAMLQQTGAVHHLIATHPDHKVQELAKEVLRNVYSGTGEASRKSVAIAERKNSQTEERKG